MSNTKQKFKKGNLVRVKTYSNELAVIEGSYADLYWGNNSTDYSIIFMDSGSSLAWVDEEDMELVDIGGEHLFEKAEVNKQKIIKQHTDLDYIRNNWQNDNPLSYSSITINYLFEKINFRSSFEKNGEFFVLYSDWGEWFPLFDKLFTENKFKNVESIFTSETGDNLKNAAEELHKEIYNYN